MNQRTDPRDLIDLPGSFTFKVIVRPDVLDGEDLLAMIDTTLDREVKQPEITSTPSRKGNYRSYSLAVHIEVYEEIEALYATFRAHEAVVFTL